jgi:hypothetical protein
MSLSAPAPFVPLANVVGGPYSATCDWGGCDERTAGYRFDPEHGWLPVCAGHSGEDLTGDS